MAFLLLDPALKILMLVLPVYLGFFFVNIFSLAFPNVCFQCGPACMCVCVIELKCLCVGVYRLLDCLAALLALRGAWGPYRHYSQALRPWAADHVALVVAF